MGVVFFDEYVKFGMMKIITKTKNLKLNRALNQHIEEKINSLERFFKKFSNKKNYYGNFFGRGKPKVEAWVEIGRTTLHHQKGKIFWAKCQMRLPGKSIRATVKSEDLRIAITELKDELQRQLKQYKNKLNVQIRKRQRISKKFIYPSS